MDVTVLWLPSGGYANRFVYSCFLAAIKYGSFDLGGSGDELNSCIPVCPEKRKVQGIVG